VILNGSHAFLQRGILHREAEHAAVGAVLLLRLAVEQIIIVLVRLRPKGAGLVLAVDTPPLLHVAALLCGELLLRMEIDAPGPAVFVVDRYPHMAAERVLAEGRYQREPRKQPLGNAPIPGIRFAIAAAVEGQAEIRFLDLEDHIAVGLDVVVGLGALVHRIVVHLETVHVGDMAGVDPALHGLQIAALLQALGNEDVSSRQGAPLDLRRSGLLLLRAHIGPHDARALDARIGLEAHALAGLRRGRHVHAFPMPVEFQPMIGAAEAVLLVAAEIERRAAVRAELVDKADLSRGIAERQKLLAEDLHALLRPVRLGNLARQQNRHPVTAHEIAHGGTRAGAHQGFAHFLVHLL
jgi:hypothetical protein